MQAALPGPQVVASSRCATGTRSAMPRRGRFGRGDRIEVVLLPLYPQYSTTTTGSSVTDVARGCGESRAGSGDPYDLLLCDRSGLHRCGHRATAEGPCSSACRAGGWCTPLRVLFSAHGLPESIVAAGDPYQWQVEQTVAAVLSAVGRVSVDWAICYQSRATPAALDRTEHHCRDRARRAGQGRGPAGPHCLRLRTFRNAGRARCRVSSSGRSAWCSRLFSCPDAGRRRRLHRGACRDGEQGGSVGRGRPQPCGGADLPRTIRRLPVPSGTIGRFARAGSFAGVSAGSSACTGQRAMTFGALTPLYPWIKAFHVIAMVAWMAGIALSAAPLCLSLRHGAWLGRKRAVQGDGTAAAAADHQCRR